MRLRHRAAVITAVAGIALTGIATAAPAMAAPAASVGAFATSGTLAGLNLAKGTLTLGGNGAVSVSPKATVSVDGATSSLAKLPLGANVKVSGTTTGGVSVVTDVKATTVAPFVSAGTVTAVTATTVTVTPIGTTKTTVIPVADKALVLLDGRTVALSALPVKANVLVAGTVTGGTTYSAKSVTALSRWSLNLTGTVSAVDAAKGTVTVNTGSPAAAVKLNVNPNASIQLNGVKVALKDLPVGATVGLSGTDSTAGATVAGITAKIAR